MKTLLRHKGLLLIIALAATFSITVPAQRPDSIAVDNPQPAIADSVYEIPELVVQAEDIVRKKDRFILFPSKDTKEISNDAIELIGNMNLPGVFLDNRTGDLSSVREGSIGYRINGAPAGTLDLRALNPHDIRKIEYITSPGLRYGDVVAVLDIYTKRPEVGISGNFSVRNSLNQGKGIYRASLKSNYRKSEFTLSAHYEYGRFRDSRMTETSSYLFENGDMVKRIREDHPYTQKEDYLQASASYSYMDTRNLFLASLRVTGFLTPETDISYTVHESRRDSDIKESAIETLHSNDIKPTLNLYYQHEFASRSLLIVDAVLNKMRIHDDDEKHYSIDNASSNSILTYGFGEKYSTISQIQYIQPIGKGRLSVGLKHSWSRSRNEYTGTLNSSSRQTRQSYDMFVEWSGSIRRLNYSFGLQGKHVSFFQNMDDIREWSIEPKVRLTYEATDKLSFHFNGNSNMFGSGLGKSSSIVYQDDKFQYIAGNSDLKPEKTYYGSLSSSFFTRNYFGDIEFSYEHMEAPLMQDVFRSQDRFVTTTINGRHAGILNISHASRIRLFGRRLSIAPRFGYRYSRWKCSSYDSSIHTWWFKGGMSYSLRRFNFSVDYYKDADALISGFSKRVKNQSLMFGVSYNVMAWKFLANMSLPLNDYLYTQEYHSVYVSDRKTFHQLDKTPVVALQVSWNFTRNNMKSHKEKRINNEDNDNGML